MGAKVCCDHKAADKTHEAKFGNENSENDQEKMDNSEVMDEKQFGESMTSLVKLAANGYPRALRSTNSKRNEFLRRHNGDMEKAAAEVKCKGHTVRTEVKDFLFGLIPYVGLPVSVVKPMWVELRRGCLIAAVFGHDLSKEETQARVFTTLGVAQGGEKMKEKSLELAIKLFWSALCKKCGLTLAKKLPVGKMVSVLDFEDKARKALVEEFRQGAQALPESVYGEVLDEKPTNRDLLELLKDKGKMSLVQAKDQAASLLTLSFQKEQLRAKGEKALADAKEKAIAEAAVAAAGVGAVFTAAKAKAGF